MKTSTRECENDSPERSLLRSLFLSLEDDLRMSVLRVLTENSGDGLSLRGLQRRLRVNHQRLARALAALEMGSLVEVSPMKVESRVYRMYKLSDNTREVLESLFRCR
ncbi:MAG: hypothetical protein NZ902_00345 [Acidilobaceae archaeon]|nr:hypothetical protein [Acidilobaceae archaeon]MCX8165287.1 hypothetical protein [Acidilobaceae archaeon]MDW7973713.1 hypothetical protein [Sulfolobales archaeon]